jgi:predicted phage baseplate assembly protein
VGGGIRGNVGPDKLKSLLGTVEGIDAGRLNNLYAAAGGQDEESLQDARDRAPQTLRNRDRAVSRDDFESLAKQAGNIKRSKALPLHHPGFPGVEVPGTVSVIVVPDLPTDKFPRPMPAHGTLQTVCAYLNDRRLLTTELFVIGPKYHEVTISASLTVSGDADLGEVKNRALAELNRYFDPLIGGEDSTLDAEGSGWPFGGGIYYSLIFRRLLFDGVLRVDSLSIKLDKDTFDPCTDVQLEDGALLANGNHDIQVSYDVNRI